MFSLKDLPPHLKVSIVLCKGDERFKIMGLREGEQIEILSECCFGGTVIIKTRQGNICVRRSELDLICEEYE
jgi:Fe2+ transport system protein FeoA